MAANNLNAYNIFDLREIAKKRLPKWLFEYVDRGAEDEVALRNNRAALERIKLRPRASVDVSGRSTEVNLLGRKQKIPLVIAPTGIAGLTWYEGEIELARAANDAGITFTLGQGSQTSLERVASQAGGHLWFQMNMFPDKSMSYKLVQRALAARFEGLVITVDAVVQPNREYNKHNGFSIPFTFNRKNVTDVITHPDWMFSVFARYVITTGIPHHENFPSALRTSIVNQPALLKSAAVSGDDLRTLRKMWPGKLLVKGILHPDDAKLAADCGVDAVVVSNHGGRYLDNAFAPIEALPEIVDAVGKRVAVLVDSGFRRGSDVVKALALGASAVQIGRATLYGTAAGGQKGAALALEFFRQEIDRVLALIGCRSAADLNRDYLQAPVSTGIQSVSSKIENSPSTTQVA